MFIFSNSKSYYGLRNYNLPAKQKLKVQKLTGFELAEERIEKFNDVLIEKKEMTNRNMKRVLKLGPGAYDRLIKDIKDDPDSMSKWIKKEKTWKYTPLTLEQAKAKQKQILEKQSNDEIMVKPQAKLDSIII